MAVTSTDYEMNYEDERFQQAETEIDNVQNQYNQTIGGMINDSDQYYNNLVDATKQWEEKQTQIQQENTDFAIEKIEQEKNKAHKDYVKEQSGAYVDWQKQSNQYGVEAEKMASAGLSGSGYSESSQVSMYNTYQNRVSTARESYNNAVLNYNNAIKDAQLQNNAALAEIAYQSLQKQLELSLQGFQYKNQLVQDLANKQIEFANTKWNRYQDVLAQLNTENALKLEVDKYNDNQAWQTEQAELDREFKAKEAELDRQFQEKLEGIKHDYDIKLLNAKTEKEKELAKQEYEYQVALEKEKLANDKALLDYQKSLSSTTISGGSGSSGSKSSSGSSGSSAKISSYGTKLDGQTLIQSKETATTKVDMSNILSLGYGPISASKLDQLVSEGKVIEYKENGVIKFKKAASTPSLKLTKY